jgi:hypothetical protein
MAIYGEMPNGWRLHNVSMGGEPAWIKTFEVELDSKQYARAVQVASKFGSAGRLVPEKTMKRRVILALNPFSGKWFWQTTGTQTDDGKGDGMEYDDPVACAVVCEMTFGSTKTYEPLRRNEGWVPGVV